MTNPIEAADKAITEALAPVLQGHDPRAIVIALMNNAASLGAFIVREKKWPIGVMIRAFAEAQAAAAEGAVSAPEEPKGKSVIHVVDATGAPKGRS